MGVAEAYEGSEDSVSLKPLNEVKYRCRLATEHLERAGRLLSLRDWAGTASQLAVENFAKAVISVFEVPTWSHDPSDELNRLKERFPSDVEDLVEELVILVRETAPEHGRASYGEPSEGLLPSDIYEEDHASSAFEKSRKASEIAEMILDKMGIKI